MRHDRTASESFIGLVWVFIVLLFAAGFGGWGITRLIRSINMEMNCTGHLKRAADANTIDLAKQELKIAIEYLERNNMTEGSTALIFRTPDADVGFWHANLKSSLEELEKLKPDASQLEKTNTLMKLRETLLDHGEKGESITCPDGISIFPYNWIFFIWGWLSFIILCIACFGVAVVFHN